MKEITLDQPKEVLQVNIGEESYTIPLAGSLPFVEALKLRKMNKEERMDFIIEFMQEHIPPNVFGKLTTDAVMQIVTAWSEASKDEQGATPGES